MRMFKWNPAASHRAGRRKEYEMTIKKRFAGAVLCAVLTATVAAASFAWACSAQSTITLFPNAGPTLSRSVATITTSEPASDAVPIQVRWGSPDGQELATVRAGQNFSVEFQVPDGAQGVYYVVAVAEGKVIARDAFEVKGSAGAGSSAVAADLWSGLESSSSMGEAAVGQEAGNSRAPAGGLALMAVGAAVAGSSMVVAVKRRRSATAPRARA